MVAPIRRSIVKIADGTGIVVAFFQGSIASALGMGEDRAGYPMPSSSSQMAASPPPERLKQPLVISWAIQIVMLIPNHRHPRFSFATSSHTFRFSA
jgi:hypothetical protein